jgi:hypothetical protein
MPTIVPMAFHFILREKCGKIVRYVTFRYISDSLSQTPCECETTTKLFPLTYSLKDRLDVEHCGPEIIPKSAQK